MPANHASLTALIPAMQLHLLDCRSNRQLVRNLAWSKLGECMMVVSELRGTYGEQISRSSYSKLRRPF